MMTFNPANVRSLLEWSYATGMTAVRIHKRAQFGQSPFAQCGQHDAVRGNMLMSAEFVNGLCLKSLLQILVDVSKQSPPEMHNIFFASQKDPTSVVIILRDIAMCVRV